MNTHATIVHARCPFMPVWDYYEVTFTTKEFIKCEELENACDEVRGVVKATQEEIAMHLRITLPEHVHIKVVGRHGSNCLTEITL